MAFAMVPPPLGLGRPSQNKKYKLMIVQNPVRVRCCGFGEKDRRPIDPPPILQLFIEQPDGSLQNANEDESNLSLFVVQCDLMSEDGKDARSHVFNPSSAISSSNEHHQTPHIPTTGTLLNFHDPAPTRSLMGAVVANAYQLMDQNNKPGIFFIFQDLSVRIEGRFCLNFMFMNLSAGDPLTMSTQVSDSVLSKPFTVYSAKNFPGMTDSTSLSQCFARQGIKISIRKGRRIRHVVDRSYSHNNNSADTQHNALASTPTVPTVTEIPSTSTSPSTPTISSSNNNSNSNSNIEITHNHHNHHSNHNHHHSEDSNSDVISATDSPSTRSDSIISSQSGSSSSNSSSSNNSGASNTTNSTTARPTYRRIDISTILTPDS